MTRKTQVQNLAVALNNYMDNKLATIGGGSSFVFSEATTLASGLMSAADKAKLDGIAPNANNYTLPTASTFTKGGVKVGTGLSMSGDTLNCTISSGSGVSTTPIVLSNSSVSSNGAMWLDPTVATASGTGTVIIPSGTPDNLLVGTVWLSE